MENQYGKVSRYLLLLDENRWVDEGEISSVAVCPCGYKAGHNPPAEEEFRPYEMGSLWGDGWDSHAWFRFPAAELGEGTYLRIKTDREGWDAANPQFLIYVKGKIRQGIDTNHREVYVGDSSGEPIYAYAYTGPRVENARLFAGYCRLVPQVNGLYYDLLYPYQLLSCVEKDSAVYAQILYHLYRAVSILELYDVGSEEFLASVERARDYMKKEFYGTYCGSAQATAVCIGHTHIDCAWRWTLEQTREKVQRSFATVLELMKHYPEYKFMSSQALLYQNLKEEAPELYREVGERIREGRWECEGAMWVEADCNLTSGESLVRQVLYGKRFFKEEFGVENRVLWLPDVFGYSAALPQILRKSGVDWFVTSKISWNDVNQMPYDTFRWKGIDGTEINSYFMTACDTKRDMTKKDNKWGRTTYNANTDARQIVGVYERYNPKHLTNEVMVTFGYGDGGGGPTAHELELSRRSAMAIPGSPKTTIEFAGDFLSRMERRMQECPDVPTWQGELYLEYHRGTYTTMANNKRDNRRCELLYQDVELLSTVAKSIFGETFPKEWLHKSWEVILTNQFHDIIPGSSIPEVYERSARDYAALLSEGGARADGVKKKIASSVKKGSGYVVFNPHSFEGDGFVRVDGKTARVKGIAPKGYTVTEGISFDCAVKVDVEGRRVETDTLTVTFNEAWQLASVYDRRADRQLLKEGATGNELRAYADYPDKYDAWEWKEYSTHEYRTLTAVSSVEQVEDGVKRGIRVTRPYGRSLVTQTVWFADGTARIDFETLVDWHEDHQMLKAAFPVDVQTDRATYEIQFGTIERPTHKNTSWDAAKYEVCGHKYADLSEGNYGVSLMNDSKYGYDVHDGVMMLSLLRAPTDPNPVADRGEHRFTYALYPHTGALRDCDTAKQAYFLNYPMTALAAEGEETVIPTVYSAVKVLSDHVICETVKESEEGTDTVIRLFEHKNIRDRVTVELGIPAKRVFLCDLMENELSELSLTNGRVTLPVRGFEILTLKVRAE